MYKFLENLYICSSIFINKEWTLTMRAYTPLLPLDNIEQWETRAVLKKAAEAHRYLAELKGIAASIPNEAILINTSAFGISALYLAIMCAPEIGSIMPAVSRTGTSAF
jgi:hypothetical protein